MGPTGSSRSSDGDYSIRKLFFWYQLVDGQVVGVAHPADGVRVVAVAVGELGWTPAGDGPTHELLGADEEAEADEDDDCVLTTEAVHGVVVHAELDFANTEYGF